MLTDRPRPERDIHFVRLDLFEHPQISEIPLQFWSYGRILSIEAHISLPALQGPLDPGNVFELDTVRIGVDLEVSSVEFVDEEVARGREEGGQFGQDGVAVRELHPRRAKRAEVVNAKKTERSHERRT